MVGMIRNQQPQQKPARQHGARTYQPRLPGMDEFLDRCNPRNEGMTDYLFSRVEMKMKANGESFNWMRETHSRMVIDGKIVEPTVIIRGSMITGYESRINPDRARRKLAPSESRIEHVEECPFCPQNVFLKTPKLSPEAVEAFSRLVEQGITDARLVDGRIVHRAFESAYVSEGCRISQSAVSFPNLNVFAPFHFVTAYPAIPVGGGNNGRHKLYLSELWFDDARALIHSEYDLALLAREMGYRMFADIMNWHEAAGGSIQHPHSQRFSIDMGSPEQGSLSTANELLHIMRRAREFYEKYGINIFDFFIRTEERDGSRVIFSNSDVYAGVPFAATSNFEVWVVPKKPIANIVETTPEQRNAIIEPVTGIFPALYFFGAATKAGEKVETAGINALNIAVYMAPFGEPDAKNYFRWHMVITPRRETRTSDRAGAEIGFNVYPISIAPEDAAAIIRQWFIGEYKGERDPRLELLATEPLREQARNCLENREQCK